MSEASEQAVVFSVGDDTLVGVLHPGTHVSDLGVLVIVGGPQYRAGSHRQFVQVARDMAALGLSTLRFDVRGMGDSSGSLRSFEQLSEDIHAAISTLIRSQPAVQRVLLWGLCDGASASLLYLHERPDPRVAGLILLNPWVRTASTQALTTVKHYYIRRLTQRGFWLKLITGRVASQALRGLWDNLHAARSPSGNPQTPTDYTVRMQRAWSAFRRPILLALSGDDYTAKEFVERATIDPGWRDNLKQAQVTRLDLPGADHTFSTPGSAAQLQDATRQWLQRTLMTNRDTRSTQ